MKQKRSLRRKRLKAKLAAFARDATTALLMAVGMWLIVLIYCRMAGPLDIVWR